MNSETRIQKLKRSENLTSHRHLATINRETVDIFIWCFAFIVLLLFLLIMAVVMIHDKLRIVLRVALLVGAVVADPPRSPVVSSLSPLSLFPAMAPTTQLKDGCPRREDIHPCECLEIPKITETLAEEIETVVFCKTIRNVQVLQNAMKGMQGHIIDFMVLDSCKLPPFPNGLFFNVGIKWMEILNSTVQFKTNFFQCANNCW